MAIQERTINAVSPAAAATAEAAPARPSRFSGTFAALRHRNYRLLWSGTLVSSSGDWMDQIAFNWLVYALTGSPVYLGLVNLCRMAPILVFTLVGGVVADRVERRKLLMTTQAAAMVMAFLLAVLVATNLIQIWMVMLIAAGRGTMMSFNQPARQSLVSELVPAEDLQNAIALSSATQNLTRIIGPTIGGLLIASIGVAGAFFVNAASFVAVLYGLSQMEFGEGKAKRRNKGGMWAELKDGLRYSAGHPSLRVLLPLALLPLVFGMPYMSMLTVFAKDVLQIGGQGLGIMTACAGAGAVIGALRVASDRGGNPTRRMMVALACFGACLIVFAWSPWLPLSLAALIGVGISQQSYMATNNTLIQTIVDPQYRGRVLSTMFLNRAMVPLGTLVAGIVTSVAGPQVAIGMMAGCLVLMAVLTAYLGRASMRHINGSFAEALANR